jgi:diguanylate cyclase (GGDEF)-like protein
MPRPTLRQLLIATFAIVCTVPVLVLAAWMYFGMQSHIMEEARDKNQLLSQNLATPISTYLTSAQESLASIGMLVSRMNDPEVMTAVAEQHYFDSIVFIARDRIVRRWPQSAAHASSADAALLAEAQQFFALGKPSQTGVLRNPYSGVPTVLFSQPADGGVVIGFLKLDPIIELGRRIKFGKMGHAAITDQDGRVVLHPNSNWISESRSIADWPIIQAGMHGKTGVMQFRSPFIKKDMVAGYASVPKFGWVVITPQPLAEFQQRADEWLRSAGYVAAGALVLALMLAAALAGWITRPIVALAEAVKQLPYTHYRAEFKELPRLAPRELDTLQERSAQMAREIRSAIQLRDNMNEELRRQVDQATKRLQETNARLASQAFIDDLTKLNNRRALWERVSDLEQSSPETYSPMQVMLFDLDNFKQINDTFGHPAGDRVLTHVASIIEAGTREGDFVVRYGGDEFLIVMRHCLASTAQQRAEAIRQTVQMRPLEINGRAISITMSIGIAESEARVSRPTFAELLKAADEAMYAAKHEGRNRIRLVHAQ